MVPPSPFAANGVSPAAAAAAAAAVTSSSDNNSSSSSSNIPPLLHALVGLPSMEEFKERIKLEKFAEKLKNAKKNSQKNIELHKPLVQRLKAELECLDTALKDILEKEEALKQRMPFASSSS
ncbi:hypothetical protein, conserved [Eimeria maxima]|uniref:Uncharacterized protein n=1 Tax=Eimeria maxima TaxID=5804 RepID=U6M310_EIMMA|nr:hypothetical protein, conserved [Eimeria maxima]CDJ56834.1 hypothetical protein, conserved [Eimeria maxima]